jgi:hypothetical protein
VLPEGIAGFRHSIFILRTIQGSAGEKNGTIPAKKVLTRFTVEIKKIPALRGRDFFLNTQKKKRSFILPGSQVPD